MDKLTSPGWNIKVLHGYLTVKFLAEMIVVFGMGMGGLYWAISPGSIGVPPYQPRLICFPPFFCL